MKPLSKRSSEADIHATLKTAAVTLWGEARARELDEGLKAAGRHIHVLFQVPLSPRDGEPDHVDNALEDDAIEPGNPS